MLSESIQQIIRQHPVNIASAVSMPQLLGSLGALQPPASTGAGLATGPTAAAAASQQPPPYAPPSSYGAHQTAMLMQQTRNLMHKLQQRRQQQQQHAPNLVLPPAPSAVPLLPPTQFTTISAAAAHSSTVAVAHQYPPSQQQQQLVQPPARPSTNHMMFLARVLVGRWCLGDRNYKKPPPMPSDSSGRLYDSCTDNVHNPTIFVVFDHSQSYPDYIIEYRCYSA